MLSAVLLSSIYVGANAMQPPKRTCGSDLNDRVSRICLPRGGYQRHSHSNHHSRSKRSIVRECCLNVCEDSNIHFYCSSPNVMPTPSQYGAITSTTANEDHFVTEQSNLNFLRSRKYGTISPEFLKEAIYVKGWTIKVLDSNSCLVPKWDMSENVGTYQFNFFTNDDASRDVYWVCFDIKFLCKNFLHLKCCVVLWSKDNNLNEQWVHVN